MTTPTILNDLADRIEKSGPDRELEAAVHAAAWAHTITIEPVGARELANCPRYLASLDASDLLKLPGYSIASGTCGEDNSPWACVTAEQEPCPDFTGHGFNEASSRTAAWLRTLAAARAGEAK